jgi:hypothetical protein
VFFFTISVLFFLNEVLLSLFNFVCGDVGGWGGVEFIFWNFPFLLQYCCIALALWPMCLKAPIAIKKQM